MATNIVALILQAKQCFIKKHGIEPSHILIPSDWSECDVGNAIAGLKMPVFYCDNITEVKVALT